MKAFLLFVIPFIGGIAVADTQVAKADSDVLKLHQADNYSASQYLHFFKDVDDSATIEDVVAADDAGQLEKNHQNVINFGFLRHPVWVRFDVSYPKTDSVSDLFRLWYIEVASSLLDIGALYQLDKNGRWIELRSDLTVPFDKRELNHVYSVFPIRLDLGETKRFYVKMKTDGSFYVPITIWDQDAYSVKVANEEFVFGIFYGAMLCIIIFNFLIFMSVKDISYIYYIAYLASVSLIFFIDLGHGVNIVDNDGTTFTKSLIGPAIWCTWIFVASFIRRFLDTEKNNPIIDSWLQLVRGVAFVYLALELVMPSAVGVRWGAIATPILTFCFPPMCIYMWRKGNTNALYFLIAWGFNMFGLSVYAGVSLGYLPSSIAMIALAPLGILSEAVLLSLALAARVKRTQKALEDADRTAMSHLARYQSVFNNALEGIYQLSLDGKFISVNPSMAHILGYSSPKQVLAAGDNAVSICYTSPKEQYGILAAEKVLKEEILFSREGGDKSWADHSARLIYDEDGEPSHIEGTFIDVSERKRREDAVKEKEQERVEKEIAKDTAAAKSDFLANMSHEIRTPLTSIIGHSEVVKSLKLTGSERENAFRTISNCSQQLLKLINDILDYSKIEAQKLDVENVELKIEDLVGELRHTYEWQTDQKGIKLYFIACGKIPKVVKTDPTRLKQILHSLLINALKFTKDGAITIMFQWDNSSGKLLIKIVDSGVGISLDQQAGLFDVFSQGSASKVRKYSGVGLGLPIAKQLARLLGGDLQLKSVLGAGSKFSLSLKPNLSSDIGWIDSTHLDLTKPKSQNKKPAVSTPNLIGTVLLAEDNPVNQKLISKIIRKTGAEVELAENGQVAVDRVVEGGIDVVLMDINMPVMDGLEATVLIRRTHKDLPIFALTAEIDTEELAKATKAGCGECLKKPVDRAQMYDALKKVLDTGSN